MPHNIAEQHGLYSMLYSMLRAHTRTAPLLCLEIGVVNDSGAASIVALATSSS